MRKWYASVNFGFEKIAADMIGAQGVTILTAADSAVIFCCARPVFGAGFNNLFEIIAAFDAADITAAAAHILRCKEKPALTGSFRILFTDEGKLRAIPPPVLAKLEAKVTRQTRQKPNRAKPDTELWIYRKHTGQTFWMTRLRKHASFDKTLQKGELRPDVVQCMIHCAHLTGRETVLDPFGGSGAIALGLGKLAHKIYTGDIDPARVQAMRTRLRDLTHCQVMQWDARALPLPDASADAIITDPPWGFFRQTQDGLAAAFFTEAFRLLTPGGRLVLLLGGDWLSQAEAFLCAYPCAYEKTACKIGGKNACLLTARKEFDRA